MIDIDQMDQQLSAALTADVAGAQRVPSSPAPAPAPVPIPAPAHRRRQRPLHAPPPSPSPSSATELLELGLLEEADAAASAIAHPRDALTWTTMRALLTGRQDPARAGVEELRHLAQRTDDAPAWDGYWVQRFWVAFEWGTEEERFDVLDHCRERAYRFDDLPWWGNLTLLLAVMGKCDEAERAFDAASKLRPDAHALDLVTNLIEGAALLGDAGRVAAALPALRAPEGRLVVVGHGVVCKGSIERYRALGLAALGRRAEAADTFRRAESVHRAIGAGPLLARTLQQASGSLVAA